MGSSYLPVLTATRGRHLLIGAVLAGIAIGAGGIGFTALAPIASALAQEQKGGGNTVRPEIGKPIQAALDLLKSKRGKDAMTKVQEADAVPNKTPYEAYLVERVRAQAAAAAGDAAAAARAFEATAASPAVSGGERLQFLAAAAGQYYLAKSYGKTAELGARYLKDGGTDRSIRTLYIQALYLGNDYARAASETLADVRAEEAAGRTPTEAQLQLLTDSYQKQKDQKGYANALEKLLAYYPKRDYWLNAIYGAAGRAGISDRLALDLARLKLATGTMQAANEYMEAAQLSLQAGYPADAKKFIDQGYAAGLLGTGPESERHRRLKDMAARNLAEDAKTLGQDDAQLAAAKDGTALLNAGFNYVLIGNSEKGLAMMEQGMRKGGLKHADDARLRLGYAYHVAGQKQKAIQVLKTVQGGDGPASLARLWIIHLGRGS
jgi:hypothetical protein